MDSSDESDSGNDEDLGLITRRVWDGSLGLTPEEWTARRPPTARDWIGAFPLKLVASDQKAQPFIGVLMARLTRAGGFIGPLDEATFWVDRERLLSDIVAGVVRNYDKWFAMPPEPLALMLSTMLAQADPGVEWCEAAFRRVNLDAGSSSSSDNDDEDDEVGFGDESKYDVVRAWRHPSMTKEFWAECKAAHPKEAGAMLSALHLEHAVREAPWGGTFLSKAERAELENMIAEEELDADDDDEATRTLKRRLRARPAYTRMKNSISPYTRLVDAEFHIAVKAYYDGTRLAEIMAKLAELSKLRETAPWKEADPWRLHSAVMKGRTQDALSILGTEDAVAVEKLVMRKDETNRTALHWAAVRGNYVAAGLLLGAGAEVDATDTHGATPLMCAATRGSKAHNACIKLLVRKGGATTDVMDAHRRTPIFFACTRGDADVVQFLLESGANPNISDEWDRTGFHLAARRRHTATVKVMQAFQHGPTRGSSMVMMIKPQIRRESAEELEEEARRRAKRKLEEEAKAREAAEAVAAKERAAAERSARNRAFRDRHLGTRPDAEQKAAEGEGEGDAEGAAAEAEAEAAAAAAEPGAEDSPASSKKKKKKKKKKKTKSSKKKKEETPADKEEKQTEEKESLDEKPGTPVKRVLFADQQDQKK